MRYAACLVIGWLALGALPASAQSSITVHPQPQPGGSGGMEIKIPPLNNPNYLDYGPLPDKPGSDHSQDYMNQAGGNSPDMSGPGSDVDADVMPDSDGAYDGPISGTPF
ncbi:hypothetical protein [Ancylobacter radicis]|uniref:Uncharacterized protein n=1 Tax=Ancylobacter radicis TaxID=2836179 RepID=A0ABS5R6B3_9HYPH|nr:hypothetical protein [Ancylobacter radicis]MBS9476431.1 hypothetical protein [Ancylobacter radicis]